MLPERITSPLTLERRVLEQSARRSEHPDVEATEAVDIINAVQRKEFGAVEGSEYGVESSGLPVVPITCCAR